MWILLFDLHGSPRMGYPHTEDEKTEVKKETDP